MLMRPLSGFEFETPGLTHTSEKAAQKLLVKSTLISDISVKVWQTPIFASSDVFDFKFKFISNFNSLETIWG